MENFRTKLNHALSDGTFKVVLKMWLKSYAPYCIGPEIVNIVSVTGQTTRHGEHNRNKLGYPGLPKILARFYTVHGKFSSFLLRLIRREIDIAEPGELMRRSSESLAAQVFQSQFFSLIGVKYLKLVAAEFVEQVQQRPKRAIKEIVIECKILIEKLRDTHIRCPLFIRQSFMHLRDTVLEQDPGNSSVVLSSFFLHYLCPAILQPSKYGLTDAPDDGNVSENLILACKLLQLAANRSASASSISAGDAPTEALIQDFVYSSYPVLQSFMDRLLNTQEIEMACAVLEASVISDHTEEEKEEALNDIMDYCRRYNFEKMFDDVGDARKRRRHTTHRVKWEETSLHDLVQPKDEILPEDVSSLVPSRRGSSPATVRRAISDDTASHSEDSSDDMAMSYVRPRSSTLVTSPRGTGAGAAGFDVAVGRSQRRKSETRSKKRSSPTRSDELDLKFVIPTSQSEPVSPAPKVSPVRTKQRRSSKRTKDSTALHSSGVGMWLEPLSVATLVSTVQSN